ncbi:MAG: YraN family protein [Muribaculaceae bacterium]|nr:YraN family protein [Muribaculaceae bacterium]
MADHNELGAWGESVAREYLIAKGYAIAAENVKAAGVEIDLIATHADRICFVEVKTRRDDFIDPLEAIDQRKRARLVKVADSWMRQYENLPLDPQFDIIIIIGVPGSYTLEHIPDAFYPGLTNYRG